MALKRKVGSEEVAWLKSEDMRKNKTTIEWLMRETATVDGDYVVLADETKIRWHIQKWPQTFEVISDNETYFYRCLDDLCLGIRDIRRNRKERYL